MLELKTGKWKRILSLVNLKTGNWFSSRLKIKTLFLTLSLLTATLPAYAVTSMPRFAYVTNNGSDNISVYTINQSTGGLTYSSTTAAKSGPVSVTVDPFGKFAYVANRANYCGAGCDPDSVSVYTIDLATGGLTEVMSAGTGSYPTSVTVDPTGKFAYVANSVSNDVSVYTIDQATGALTAVMSAGTGSYPTSVIVDPTGKFAYVANSVSNDVSVYTIDQTTGALTEVMSAGTGSYPTSVTVDPTGKFAYVASLSNDVSVYTINPATGALTAVMSAGTGSYPTSVIVDPTGKFAYVANTFSNNVSVYTIDPATGELTAGSSVLTGGWHASSITVDPSGKFAYVANEYSDNVSVYSINQTTGELTLNETIFTRYAPTSIVIAGTPVGTPIPVNGTCGAAGGQFFTSAPETNLCTSGTVSTAPTGTSPWNWTCGGSNGGTDAPCSASLQGTYVPKFAYVVNNQTNDVSVYTIDPATGALTAGTAVATGTDPISVTVDPFGKFAYVANYNGYLWLHMIDPSTGALTGGNNALTSGSRAWSGYGFSVAVDPTGKFAYVVSSYENDALVYTIDQTTGELTYSSAAAVGPGSISITVDPSWRFAYVANAVYDETSNTGTATISVYKINQTTGALTYGTTVPTEYYPISVAVDPTGRFAYVADYNSATVSVYKINQTTGALTAGTAVATGSSPRAIAVDPTGRFAYVANEGSFTVSVYKINQTTGALTPGTAVTGGKWPQSVAVDSTGKFAYVANAYSDVSVYLIDQTTGALTAGTGVVAGGYPCSITTTGRFAAVLQVKPSGASLAANPASPQAIGANVTFTAGGQGGTGDYEYLFKLKTDATWTVVQGYSSTNTWTWDTAGLAAGIYSTTVYVRNAGSTAAYEAWKSISYTLFEDTPVTAVSLVAVQKSPQAVGAQVEFDATATGTTDDYVYQYWVKTGITWAMVQDYTATNSSHLTWDTSNLAPGIYTVRVWAKNASSPTAYEAARNMTYTIVQDSPVTAVSLVAVQTSPQAVGTPVEFDASATGATDDYVYQYWVKTGITWAVVQDYPATNSSHLAWDTSNLAPGIYTVQVRAKNASSSMAYEAAKNMTYAIVQDTPVTAVSLVPIQKSPRTVGTQVEFNASATGTTDDYVYQYWVKTGITWAMVQDYTAMNSSHLTWDTSNLAPGIYTVQVRAKNAGSIVVYEATSRGTTQSSSCSLKHHE